MACYIISFDPAPMKEFQKQMPFLDDAIWINEKKNLNEVKSQTGDSFFFIHLTKGGREALDEIVLIIRDQHPNAKIIYLTEDPKAHKAHQLTPVGGDAYVPFTIGPQNLMDLLQGLIPLDLNQHGNRLEGSTDRVQISATKGLEEMKNHPKSKEIDQIFSEVFGSKAKKPLYQSVSTLVSVSIPDELAADAGVEMSDKDKELSLDDLGDLELSAEGVTEEQPQEDSGLELDFGSDADLDISAPDEMPSEQMEDSGMELDLDEGFSLDDSSESSEDSSSDDEVSFSLGDDDSSSEELSLGDDNSEAPSLDFALDESSSDEVGLDLGGEDDTPSLSLGDESDDLSLDLGAEDSVDIDLSDDAKEKLKEIDAIMDHDASQVAISMSDIEANEDSGLSLGDDDSLLSLGDSDLDKSLVGDDVDLGSINFSSDEPEAQGPVKEVKKKTKEPKESREAYDGNMGKELKEISGAYSGEMERMQATISNLRADREELLAKIQKLEEDKVIQNRQSLTMRAELDEKKIELSIIRKKLNDEISELKDRLKIHDEKKLILEEKNKILMVELDKAAQKNKIDVKKVQMRERELEQKLELLKADSETQIRHRDLKILELKRKLDAMEFDMESISVQEKKSVESRFELEDKLDKAIKTLRNAISVLEDENDNKSGALAALKKNIEM